MMKIDAVKIQVYELKFDVAGTPFERLVEGVTENTKDWNIEAKNEVIEALCEQYVLHYGKLPDSWQLQLLANVILQDDFANPSKYKTQEEEYSFHSETQRKRRKRKEFSTVVDTLEHMRFKKKANLSTAPPRDITI